MTDQSTRREFIQRSTAIAAGCWVGGTREGWTQEKSANSAIRFACIGVDGGKGASDRDDAGRHGDIVALCDINEDYLEKAASKFPKAKKYHDYRVMYDEMADQIDAITVSTPDHTHATAAIRGMKMGKHCFCQKPLTYTIAEARLMREVAAEKSSALRWEIRGQPRAVTAKRLKSFAKVTLVPSKRFTFGRTAPSGLKAADIQRTWKSAPSTFIGICSSVLPKIARIIPPISHSSGVAGWISVPEPSVIWPVIR